MKIRTRWQADMVLVFCTLWWGLSNVGMDFCLRETNPLTLNAWRFLLGAAVVLPFGWNRFLTGLNRVNLRYGMLIGCALTLAYICATYGVIYTSVANTGFLCSMAVIFTPVLYRLLGVRPERRTLLCIVLSFTGVALLTVNKGFGLHAQTFRGDLLCLLCSLFYAVDLILTERAVREEGVDAFTIGVTELLFTGLVNLLLSRLLYAPQTHSGAAYYGVLLFLAVLCTGLPFALQPIAQQYTTAARVGVIFTLEPVFNVAAAVLIAGERLTTRSCIGGAIMVLSLLLMECEPRRREKAE